jgi:hypothetical protein
VAAKQIKQGHSRRSEGLTLCGIGPKDLFLLRFQRPEKNRKSATYSVPSSLNCLQNPIRATKCSPLYSQYDAGTRQTSKDALTECLDNILQMGGQPPIYLNIDAVDECPNTSTSDLVSPRDRVLGLVEKLIALHLPNLRVCVTTRPEADIRASLEFVASPSISFHDQSGQRDDISKYFSSAAHSDRNMRKWRPEDKRLVIETLSRKAGRMLPTRDAAPLPSGRNQTGLGGLAGKLGRKPMSEYCAASVRRDRTTPHVSSHAWLSIRPLPC